MLRLPPLSALLGLVLALVLAGPAGGRSSAEPPAALFVFPYDSTPGAAAEHDIDLTLPDSSTLAIAAVTNYVPPGYTVALATAPGTVIGSATIFVSGQDAPISADLLTTDPAASAADPKAQACAAGAHAAVWKAALTVDGAAFPLSVFVDPTTADETAR